MEVPQTRSNSSWMRRPVRCSNCLSCLTIAMPCAAHPARLSSQLVGLPPPREARFLSHKAVYEDMTLEQVLTIINTAKAGFKKQSAHCFLHISAPCYSAGRSKRSREIL